jgi:hypothetical protein
MRTFVISATALLVACASTPGARPHDMSAEQHEAAAAAEESRAGQHHAQFDPEASERETRCIGPHPSSQPCWSSLKNSTEGHRKEAEEHARAAADHRAGSQALKDAEARACVGVPAMDRDMSPFDHREDIASVKPLEEPTTLPKGSKSVVGAVVTFRAVPGMTAQWFQRVVDCHLARNAALGHVVPEMPYCPLVPRGVTASVSSTADGFAVAIRGSDADTAEEVLRRSNALLAH